MMEDCGGKKSMLLAGDIGATKTILALFEPETGPREPFLEREVITASYPDLETLILRFLDETGRTVSGAVFGIAAPVKKGRAVMINLPWVIEEEKLMRALGIEPVCFLNDLEAIANAVPILKAEDLHPLNEGTPDPDGNIAVIAPGTGLGEAFLVSDGKGHRSMASEGGHADFAPSSPVEMDLLKHLRGKYEHVSYERVCSGPGIFNIFEFLKAAGVEESPSWLSEEIAGADDPTPVIVKAATQKRNCGICERTLEIFTSILGAEAGNLALKVLATSGVYVAGGIPPRILGFLEKGNFMQAFRSKGREEFLLENIPVRVVLNKKSGLIGAAAYGLNHF